MANIEITTYNYEEYQKMGLDINGAEYFSNDWHCPNCGEPLPDSYGRELCPLCKVSERLYNDCKTATFELLNALKNFDSIPGDILRSFIDEWEQEESV